MNWVKKSWADSVPIWQLRKISTLTWTLTKRSTERGTFKVQDTNTRGRSPWLPITTLSPPTSSSTILLENLAVILDRTQGGGSIFEDEVEMIHRRLLRQGLCQMNETHNETSGSPNAYEKGVAIRGTYHVLMSSSINDASFEPIKVRSQELYMHPQISFIATNLDFKTWSSHYKSQVIYIRLWFWF